MSRGLVRGPTRQSLELHPCESQAIRSLELHPCESQAIRGHLSRRHCITSNHKRLEGTRVEGTLLTLRALQNSSLESPESLSSESFSSESLSSESLTSEALSSASSGPSSSEDLSCTCWGGFKFNRASRARESRARESRGRVSKSAYLRRLRLPLRLRHLLRRLLHLRRRRGRLGLALGRRLPLGRRRRPGVALRGAVGASASRGLVRGSKPSEARNRASRARESRARESIEGRVEGT